MSNRRVNDGAKSTSLHEKNHRPRPKEQRARWLAESHFAKLPLEFMPMQKYVYSFQSSVGTFWIRPERNKSWGLYIGGEGIIELLGYYGSAFAAADSVYMQTTGWDGWDRSKRIDAPPTLLLWSRKPVK